MICANDVTSKVASKPSEPWTSTDAPSYKQIHVLYLLLFVYNGQIPVLTFSFMKFLVIFWILCNEAVLYF